MSAILASSSAPPSTTNAYRYQISYRILSEQERIRIINKEMEVDVVKEVPLGLNHFNTVTESISVSSASQNLSEDFSKMNSLDNSLPEF